MGINRRNFLKILGFSALGLGIKPVAPFFLQNKLNAKETSHISKSQQSARWAMVVDIKNIDEKTAKNCIDACHVTHNVPDIPDPRHEVKWIWTEPFRHTFPSQTHNHIKENLKEKKVLVFCNNCDNPPCVRVCPTKATFKRDDGIVMMDMHRCIGCRFCMAGCPYGSRSFNWKDPRPFISKDKTNTEFPTREKGVVEKCDFCAERIDKGLEPKCVEASNGTLFFGNLNDPDSKINKLLKKQYTIRRKPSLGTGPAIYYII